MASLSLKNINKKMLNIKNLCCFMYKLINLILRSFPQLQTKCHIITWYSDRCYEGRRYHAG